MKRLNKVGRLRRAIGVYPKKGDAPVVFKIYFFSTSYPTNDSRSQSKTRVTLPSGAKAWTVANSPRREGMKTKTKLPRLSTPEAENGSRTFVIGMKPLK